MFCTHPRLPLSRGAGAERLRGEPAAAERLPFQGSCRRRRLRGGLFPARPLRLGFAEPPPLEGEAFGLSLLSPPPIQNRQPVQAEVIEEEEGEAEGGGGPEEGGFAGS